MSADNLIINALDDELQAVLQLSDGSSSSWARKRPFGVPLLSSSELLTSSGDQMCCCCAVGSDGRNGSGSEMWVV